MNQNALAPALTEGVRVRVKNTAPYLRGHLGMVEKVGHEVIEVRLDLTPDGHAERVWPFDRGELELLPRNQAADDD